MVDKAREIVPQRRIRVEQDGVNVLCDTFPFRP